MTKSLHRYYRKIRKRMTEEMDLQMFPGNRYWRCRHDVQRQSVPQSGSGDRKSSIADGWKTGVSDNKRWCRCRAETLTSLDSRWLIEFRSKVRRSCVAFVYQNRQLKLDVLRHLQPVQLCQEWRDAVVPRCGKHEPSSRIQHWLHPLGKMGWNASQHCITIVQALQNEGWNQWLNNGARNWATNTPQLTQNRKTELMVTVFETCDLIDTSASM